jgi:ribose transport system permease protein
VLITAIVAVGTAAEISSPVFLTTANVVEILRATSTYFIVACPVAMLMIAGGLDFSVGATFSVGAIIAATAMTHGVPWPVAIAVGITVGAATGLVGGGIVVAFAVPPMIATLSVFFVATGLVSVSAPSLIAPLPDGFVAIGQGDLLGVPLLVWYALAVGALSWTTLEWTKFGYRLRAIGGHRAAAHANGVPASRVELTAYALCGGTAALAGILYAARTSAAQPSAGGYLVTLQVLTIVLVGGVSLSGGIGSIGGVALGSVLVSELQNALGVSAIDPLWSDVFIGAVLAVTVAADGVRRRRRYVEAGGSRPSVSREELTRVIARGEGLQADRVIDAVSSERRRIERDLHDGVQQKLVNAALTLRLASDQLHGSHDDQVADLLAASIETLGSALEELRDVGRGIYPVLLRRHGLVPALESLARSSAVPIEFDSSAVPRLPEQAEITAYFVVAEALTNVMKHACAKRVSVALSHDGRRLGVSITDDGVGGATPSDGTGLHALRERIRALGGDLLVISPPGGGTTLVAEIPATATDR